MWGQLMPHSAKDILPANRPINARAENLTENKMFRDLLKENRCLVPASGFFEWKHEGKRKVPFYIHKKNDPVFGFAGLYDTWQNPAGVTLQTYTIITTAANEVVAPLHDRMPVMLKQEDEMRWLSKDALPADEMQRILAPYLAADMEVYPVSERVNKPDADDEKLIEPVKGLF
jgi:putative SOS response-associated peptidase YedK